MTRHFMARHRRHNKIEIYVKYSINQMLTSNQLIIFLESVPGIDEITKKSNYSINQVAEMVLNLFGPDNFVLDNVLESTERKFLYFFEELGFVESITDDVVISAGRYWRIHYWILKEDRIIKYLDKLKDVKKLNYDEMYKVISDELWKNNNTKL